MDFAVYGQMSLWAGTSERKYAMRTPQQPASFARSPALSPTGEQELWRGQPAWLGYISFAVVTITCCTTPVVFLLDRGGLFPALAVVVMCGAGGLIAWIVYGGWKRTGDRYVLTTSAFHYSSLSVRRRDRRMRTIPLAAVESVTVHCRWWQKLLGVGNVSITLFGDGDGSPFRLVLPDIPEPVEVVALMQRRLQLLSVDADDDLPLDAVGGLEASRVTVVSVSRSSRVPIVVACVSGLCALGVLVTVGVGMREDDPPDVSLRDDPIYREDGTKRSREDIIWFMRTRVLPFAQVALGPVVGGSDLVSCETCHGEAPESREYRMPAVAALPRTQIVGDAMARSARVDDVQMHNAVVGVGSDAGKAPTAEYMQRVVLPGMAALLNRPVYDRAKPYEYNKTRFAFGCYHCHRLKQDEESGVASE